MADDGNMMSTVKAVSYNMVLQVIFRVGTFLMNAVLLRYMTKEVLGVVNVRLNLLYYTIIFISREAFRKACLSRSTGKMTNEKQKMMINLIWMCVVIGMISSTVLSFVWVVYLEQPSPSLVYQYNVCVTIFAISAVIELICEPLWIFGQCYQFIVLKVVLDGIYVTTRCLISVLMVIFLPELGLLSFGVAFCISSFLYTFLYYCYFSYYISLRIKEFPFTSFRDLFPDFRTTAVFDPYYTNLVLSFYKQSLIKQFLTEGEKYMMTLFSILSFGEQGVYDIINNLGSLAARIIFMPVEESYYTFYSRLLIRGKSGKDIPSEDSQQAAKSLSVVLKFVSLIGFIILVFGYSYSYLLLHIYGGKILTDNEGPILLRTYCLYVLVIAINGITECFMFAAMHKSEVDRYNYKMLVFSAIFMIASLLLTKHLGAVGFILANCVNMLLRIGHSMRFIHHFFKDTEYRPLFSMIPSGSVLISLAASWMITCISERTFCCEHGNLHSLIHISCGALCLLSVLLAIYFTEHQLSYFVQNLVWKTKVNSGTERVKDE